MRGDRSQRLTILSEAEKLALYGLPDFDDFQRIEFFAMTNAERDLALRRDGLLAQVYCLLQTGYFKAKQAFFRFSLQDVPPEDIAFLLQRYFPGQTQTMQPLPTKEYYAQRNEIAALFGYRLWANEDLSTLFNQAALLARADVTPAFLLTELMTFLIGQRIVRPGYTTLQTIIRDALSAERQRLEKLVEETLDATARGVVQNLLAHEKTLSEPAAIKTRRQELWAKNDGRGASEACDVGTALRNGKSAATQPRHLTFEHRLLRQPRQFLHDLRPAQAQIRPMQPLSTLLRLAALSPTLRQSGRCVGLPHEAARRRD
jgi:hypothetical protein